jgi:hypothetical protein
MDFLRTLKNEELVSISADFNYLRATQDFVGLKLLPMARTENLKVAIYDLTKGADVPVVALVHALDSEARIGDRPTYEEIKAELFLVKEKLNQGEELRKKIKDLGMSGDEATVLNAIYDDINHLISKVLTAFEKRACELLSTGKIVINENGAVKTVNYGFNEATNKVDFTGWSVATHDIVADIIALRKASKNKIVRMIMSSTVMGYILANDKLNAIAEKAGVYVTEDWAKSYIAGQVGVEIIVDDRTYKLSHKDTTEYRFFPENVVVSLTTRNAVGKTLMTSTPIEDGNTVDGKYGFVAVSQWRTEDPVTSWTKAEGVGMPVIAGINSTLYLSTIS